MSATFSPTTAVLSGQGAHVGVLGNAWRVTKVEWVLLAMAPGRFRDRTDNVRTGSAPRETIQHGLEELRSCIGEYPRVHANHSDNLENIEPCFCR